MLWISPIISPFSGLHMSDLYNPSGHGYIKECRTLSINNCPLFFLIHSWRTSKNWWMFWNYFWNVFIMGKIFRGRILKIQNQRILHVCLDNIFTKFVYSRSRNKMKQLDVDVSPPAFSYHNKRIRRWVNNLFELWLFSSLSFWHRQTDRRKVMHKSPPCMNTGGLKKLNQAKLLHIKPI